MIARTDDFFDALERRTPAKREKALFAALPAQIAHAKKGSPYFKKLLCDVTPADVKSRAALARLPVTRKSELIALQQAEPPLGGLAAVPLGGLSNIYQSPGPIYDAQGRDANYWRLARALYAAGLRAGDVLHNTFAYHFTPAGAMVEAGAHALGCAVFPAGVGQTELQVQAIAAIRPTAFAGTPSFLKVLLEKGREMGADLGSLRNAVVGGEALPPALRKDIEASGINVQQMYASADLGLIAYESSARQGLIVDEALIVEIVRPGTGEPVPEGEVGEVVVTTFARAYPLIRFGTGDLSAVLAGVSPCGRTNVRLKGWMGRADQATKVKGMFVQPAQVAEVLRRHPEVGKARLVVDQKDGKDVMTLICEIAVGGDAGLATAIAATIQSVAKLKGEVAFAKPGALPNDGKVIDDVRRYD